MISAKLAVLTGKEPGSTLPISSLPSFSSPAGHGGRIVVGPTGHLGEWGAPAQPEAPGHVNRGEQGC